MRKQKLQYQTSEKQETQQLLRQVQTQTSRLQTFCLLLPFISVVSLIICFSTVSSLQNLYLAFFQDSSNISISKALILLSVGVATIVLMIPFTIFELAVGYTCPSYILPVALCIAAKLIGETICFFIGRYLSPALKPQLNEFRFFTAVETLTQSSPFKASILMRLSVITPQLVINYGSGVLKTIPYFKFQLASQLVGIPHTILATLAGKEINKISDIYSSFMLSQNVSPAIRSVELSIFGFSILAISFIIYNLVKLYKQSMFDQLEPEQLSLAQTNYPGNDIEMDAL